MDDRNRFNPNYNYGAQPGPYPSPTPPPAPPKKKLPLWAKLVGGGGALLILGGSCMAIAAQPDLAMPAGTTRQAGPTPSSAPTYDPGIQTPPTTQAPPAPKPVEEAPPRVPGDGTLLVGKDVLPGTYQTRVIEGEYISSCYWSRLRDTDDSIDSIIDNDLKTTAGALMTLKIRATDYAVEINCDGATWTRVGS